ncbi:acyl-CoA dehydrogenase family protein [Sphingobium sp. HBC34]|uniref:Acyl-CoA dehydrogenase family protein n=1 Tax=Sphingobium cyanobacteriorum TaxID=3063954 RepID=A0ABT8ZIT1_9SPHN|nr:acyl-CoA dehydrogenase family protein [Sphingobium sp. HBC34]MDO7833456.1 acyl-CoA dehydrogenase family protein [Sphingobium sp. HBC34]
MIHNKDLHGSRGEFPLLSEARRLAPLLASKAESNEAAGKVSDESIAAMRDAGFFSLMVQKSAGGMEANPVELLSVVEAVCNIDAATGWVMMAANVATTSAAAFLPDTTYEALFKGARPIIAGAGAPTGKAEVEGGGFRLTGRWAYGSGCLNSDYIHAGAMIYENGAPRLIPGTSIPESRIFIFPTKDAQMLGNWDVIGLRATGSVDYAATDLYVPADFTHSASEIVGKRGGDSYRIGVVGFSAIGHTGFALGHGRRVLDQLASLVTAPSDGRPSTLSELAGSDAFKQEFAVAEAKLRAARALAYEAWNDITETTSRSEPVATRQFTLARLALCHATTVMMENSLFAHRVSGGVGLRAGALQRSLRDTLAATQHLVVSDKSLRDCGRDLLGMAEGMKWTPRGLAAAG